MNYYKPTSSLDYQETFYKENNLQYLGYKHGIQNWGSDDGNYIYHFGSFDTIQCGVGNYSIQSDFMVEYQYDTAFLHLGIIYQGCAYSVIGNNLVKAFTPCAFLSVEHAANRVNCWKSGQSFHGVELSINLTYVKEFLLPFLGYEPNALEFLTENIQYQSLPSDMTDLIRKLQNLIMTASITEALLRSIALEVIAHILHPKNQSLFNFQEQSYQKEITIGNRKIRLTKDDIQKIILVHDKLLAHSTAFHTIYELSQEFQIGEQKLKNGFREMYQISLWDFANGVRMNLAVELLLESSLSVLEISRQIGYQSQAAFITSFKKWTGIAPGQFRIQMKKLK